VIACGASTPPRLVTVYALSTCPAPSGSNATYQATGDFSPPPQQGEPLTNPPYALSKLPADTRSMLVEVEGFAGVSLVDETGAVDVLALPFLPFPKPCALPGQVNTPAASLTDPGETMGLIDAHHALIVGGSSAAPLASVIDLGTGSIAAALPQLAVPRNDASVTAFGTGALVAGGTDPTNELVEATAEVYVPSSNGGVGGFEPSGAVFLGGPRTKHGAVQLPTGETLLIGGFDGMQVLSSLEFVAPGASTSKVVETGSPPRAVTLAIPRSRPTVFLLPTGQVFVGGGFDEKGQPIASVEWLDADLNKLQSSAYVPFASPLCMTSEAQGFAPLESGAVLAVFGDAPLPGCSNVLVVRAPTSPGEQVYETATALSPPPTAPMLLFAGAESSPVLLTSEGAEQWGPWRGGFTPLLGIGTSSSLPTLAMLSADPGLALWVEEDSFVHALRFSARNVYSTDTAGQPALLGDDVNDPNEFAPDRLVGADVSSEGPGVALQNSASVFLTDATFADVSIEFSASGPLELVLRDNVLGTPFYFFQGTCLPPLGSLPTSLQVVRTGSTVKAGVTGQSVADCMTGLMANERVAIGFQGPGPGEGTATVSSVTVRRLGSAD
jgi:hypothetical protein